MGPTHSFRLNYNVTYDYERTTSALICEWYRIKRPLEEVYLGIQVLIQYTEARRMSE